MAISKIEVRVPEHYIIEVLNRDVISQKADEGIYLEAQKYKSRIEIHNIGNISAFNTELYLEKLEYKSNEFTDIQEIETIGSPLSWSGTEKSSIIIPPTGKKLIEIMEFDESTKTIFTWW